MANCDKGMVVLIIMAVCMLIIMAQSIYLIKVKKEKQTAAEQYEELNRILTEQIAQNLDMQKQFAELEQDMQKQQEMADEIRHMQEQSRLLKHDMKNHTLVLLSYLEEEKMEEAKQYASDILDKLNKMYTYVNVGNALLNYIINHKLSKAKEFGIAIKAEIENLEFSYIDSVDFSALLNNMLDNAIRGALESKEKRLEVKILSAKGFDVILMKNSIDQSVLEQNPELVSTKTESGHGYGIRQMQTITEKYNGTMELDEEAGMFIVRVMF